MFKADELLKATKGRLVWGRKELRVKGISIDSRRVKPQECFLAIKGNNFNGHDFIDEAIKKGASCIIKNSQVSKLANSPGAAVIEVEDTIRALGDIARFWRRQFPIPVIAVTGSNGKTTAKEMVACALSQKFNVLKNEGTKNNQIGLPLTLLNLKQGQDIAVLELGTNHFGEVRNLSQIAQPNIGIIMNIGPAHLEFLKDLKGVFQEKYALIESLKNPCLAVLNSDDNYLKKKISGKSQRPFTVSFGIKQKADFFASGIKCSQGRISFRVNKYKFTLSTPGVYNIYNALAGIAVARVFGIEYKEIIKRLANFNFPEGRLNLVTLKKVRFINDTYNSNPLSLGKALETLASFKVKGRRILVMGDMRELGRRQEAFHSEAGRKIARACDIFIAVGRLSKLAAEAAEAAGFATDNIFSCENALQARDILSDKISPRPEDIVLVKGSRAMKMEEVLKI